MERSAARSLGRREPPNIVPTRENDDTWYYSDADVDKHRHGTRISSEYSSIHTTNNSEEQGVSCEEQHFDKQVAEGNAVNWKAHPSSSEDHLIHNFPCEKGNDDCHSRYLQYFTNLKHNKLNFTPNTMRRVSSEEHLEQSTSKKDVRSQSTLHDLDVQVPAHSQKRKRRRSRSTKSNGHSGRGQISRARQDDKIEHHNTSGRTTQDEHNFTNAFSQPTQNNQTRVDKSNVNIEIIKTEFHEEEPNDSNLQHTIDNCYIEPEYRPIYKDLKKRVNTKPRETKITKSIQTVPITSPSEKERASAKEQLVNALYKQFIECRNRCRDKSRTKFLLEAPGLCGKYICGSGKNGIIITDPRCVKDKHTLRETRRYARRQNRKLKAEVGGKTSAGTSFGSACTRLKIATPSQPSTSIKEKTSHSARKPVAEPRIPCGATAKGQDKISNSVSCLMQKVLGFFDKKDGEALEKPAPHVTPDGGQSSVITKIHKCTSKNNVMKDNLQNSGMYHSELNKETPPVVRKTCTSGCSSRCRNPTDDKTMCRSDLNSNVPKGTSVVNRSRKSSLDKPIINRLTRNADIKEVYKSELTSRVQTRNSKHCIKQNCNARNPTKLLSKQGSCTPSIASQKQGKAFRKSVISISMQNNKTFETIPKRSTLKGTESITRTQHGRVLVLQDTDGHQQHEYMFDLQTLDDETAPKLIQTHVSNKYFGTDVSSGAKRVLSNSALKSSHRETFNTTDMNSITVKNVSISRHQNEPAAFDEPAAIDSTVQESSVYSSISRSNFTSKSQSIFWDSLYSSDICDDMDPVSLSLGFQKDRGVFNEENHKQDTFKSHEKIFEDLNQGNMKCADEHTHIFPESENGPVAYTILDQTKFCPCNKNDCWEIVYENDISTISGKSFTSDVRNESDLYNPMEPGNTINESENVFLKIKEKFNFNSPVAEDQEYLTKEFQQEPVSDNTSRQGDTLSEPVINGTRKKKVSNPNVRLDNNYFASHNHATQSRMLDQRLLNETSHLGDQEECVNQGHQERVGRCYGIDINGERSRMDKNNTTSDFNNESCLECSDDIDRCAQHKTDINNHVDYIENRPSIDHNSMNCQGGLYSSTYNPENTIQDNSHYTLGQLDVPKLHPQNNISNQSVNAVGQQEAPDNYSEKRYEDYHEDNESTPKKSLSRLLHTYSKLFGGPWKLCEFMQEMLQAYEEEEANSKKTGRHNKSSKIHKESTVHERNSSRDSSVNDREHQGSHTFVQTEKLPRQQNAAKENFGENNVNNDMQPETETSHHQNMNRNLKDTFLESHIIDNQNQSKTFSQQKMKRDNLKKDRVSSRIHRKMHTSQCQNPMETLLDSGRGSSNQSNHQTNCRTIHQNRYREQAPAPASNLSGQGQTEASTCHHQTAIGRSIHEENLFNVDCEKCQLPYIENNMSTRALEQQESSKLDAVHQDTPTKNCSKNINKTALQEPIMQNCRQIPRPHGNYQNTSHVPNIVKQFEQVGQDCPVHISLRIPIQKESNVVLVQQETRIPCLQNKNIYPNGLHLTSSIQLFVQNEQGIAIHHLNTVSNNLQEPNSLSLNLQDKTRTQSEICQEAEQQVDKITYTANIQKKSVPISKTIVQEDHENDYGNHEYAFRNRLHEHNVIQEHRQGETEHPKYTCGNAVKGSNATGQVQHQTKRKLTPPVQEDHEAHKHYSGRPDPNLYNVKEPNKPAQRKNVMHNQQFHETCGNISQQSNTGVHGHHDKLKLNISLQPTTLSGLKDHENRTYRLNGNCGYNLQESNTTCQEKSDKQKYDTKSSRNELQSPMLTRVEYDGKRKHHPQKQIKMELQEPHGNAQNLHKTVVKHSQITSRNNIKEADKTGLLKNKNRQVQNPSRNESKERKLSGAEHMRKGTRELQNIERSRESKGTSISAAPDHKAIQNKQLQNTRKKPLQRSNISSQERNMNRNRHPKPMSRPEIREPKISSQEQTRKLLSGAGYVSESNVKDLDMTIRNRHEEQNQLTQTTQQKTLGGPNINGEEQQENLLYLPHNTHGETMKETYWKSLVMSERGQHGNSFSTNLNQHSICPKQQMKQNATEQTDFTKPCQDPMLIVHKGSLQEINVTGHVEQQNKNKCKGTHEPNLIADTGNGNTQSRTHSKDRKPFR